MHPLYSSISSIRQSIHSLVHSSVNPFTRSFIRQSIHSFIHPSIHSIIHSCTHYNHPSIQASIILIHPSVHLSINPSIHSFIHPSIQQSIQSSIHALMIIIHPSIHPLYSSVHPSFHYCLILYQSPMLIYIARTYKPRQFILAAKWRPSFLIFFFFLSAIFFSALPKFIRQMSGRKVKGCRGRSRHPFPVT